MYCPSCGKLNEDDAAYCVACGKALARTAGGYQGGPPAVRYTAEMVPGQHEHILSDTALRDEKGADIYVARRLSMLHLNFDVLDPQGRACGHVSHKAGLAHISFEVSDTMGSILCVVKAGTVRSRGRVPDCWIEDTNGNRQGTFQFQIGILSFVLRRPDGSPVFGAQVSTVGGLDQRLHELGSRRYAITLFDPGYPILELMGVIVAFDNGVI